MPDGTEADLVKILDLRNTKTTDKADIVKRYNTLNNAQKSPILMSRSPQQILEQQQDGQQQKLQQQQQQFLQVPQPQAQPQSPHTIAFKKLVEGLSDIF